MKTYGRKSRGRSNYDTTLNFDLICRLCLSEDGEMKDLYQEEESSAPPIPLQIMASVSLAVYENDGLPTQVCGNCLEHIEKYYVFKQKCEESDAQLRKVLKHMRTLRGVKDENELQDKPEKEDLPLTDPLEMDETAGTSTEAAQQEEEPKKQSPNRRNTRSSPNKGRKSMDELLVVCENRKNAMSNPSLTATSADTYVLEMDGEEVNPDTMECTILIDLPIDATSSDQVTETIIGYNDLPILAQREHDYDRVEAELGAMHYEHIVVEEQTVEEELEEEVVAAPMRRILVRKRVLKNEPQEEGQEVCEETESYGYMDEGIEAGLQEEIRRQEMKRIQEDTSNLVRAFECQHCPKKFVKRIDLRRHLSVHQDKKALGVLKGFDCEVCDKWFPNTTTLKRHERSHTGERPFACKQCDRRFSQAGILQRHIMTHTGLKPFTCEVCSKGFTQREGLKVHLKTHGPKNPDEISLHECPLCDKSFCHPSGLSRHLLIHTGKTFTCVYCSKAFTDPSSLRRHVKRHEDDGVRTAK